MSKEGAENYYSKDFEWDELRHEIENDPSLAYHFDTLNTTTSATSSSSPLLPSQAWNSFHARHSTGKFFKERHYLLKEFPELASCDEYSTVLEVGCGNGSTALSILRGKETITVYACDCSTEALERTKEVIDAAMVISAKHRFRLFCCDFSTNGFPKWLTCNSCKETFPQEQRAFLSDVKNNGNIVTELTSSTEADCCTSGVDFVTLIFTLSAVPLDRMSKAIAECFSVLKPGGLLLFRDYGLYDMTMLRFEPSQKVGYREYMRSDGIHSYFFSLDSTRDLFIAAGFIEQELEYCCIKSVNRRNGKSMRRVWIHGKFRKPT